jgi:hypothetical protein
MRGAPTLPVTAMPPRAVEPDAGVIEEARERRRHRRQRQAIAAIVSAVALGGVVAWAVSSGAGEESSQRSAAPNGPLARNVSDSLPSRFNVRLYPMLRVGQAGWCEAVEENGVTGSSACGGVPTVSQPFLMVMGWGDQHHETTAAVTDPQIVAVVVDGKQRVPTVELPGLPYGLRAARFATKPGLSTTLVAIDKEGRALPERWGDPPLQATLASWRFPQRPPRGACELQAGGLPGLTASGGTIARTLRPFPGQLVGFAPVACISTEYKLHGVPLKAIVALDAAHPGTPPAPLPNFRPVRGASGFFVQGSLAARRSGNAWLIVGQGSSLHQQMRLLRHLSAVVNTRDIS